MKRRFSAFASAALALTVSLAASAKLISIGESSSRFQATGPAGMKINGSASAVSTSDDGARLKISVSLADVQTGIGLRDRHTKKYLKVEQFPNATLVVDRAKITVPEDNRAGSGDATGDFTLAGVTKPLAFHYDVNRTGSDLHVTGKAVIDIRNHGIETPCYLGVCVDPNVKVIVSFKLRDQP